MKFTQPFNCFFKPYHPLWSEGFRPFFLLLPVYAVVSMVLWGLLWGGVINLGFTGNVLYWHIYEMLFGLGTAGILGFLFTAIPEFIEGSKPVVGRGLVLFFGWWALARLSFWLFPLTGVWVNLLLHVSLSLALLAILAKPIWQQPDKRHIGLWLTVLLLSVLQAGFFISQMVSPFTLLGISFTPMQLLYASVTAFMLLIVLVLRRVSMGVINTLLEQYESDAVFLARPPMYHLAALSLCIYLVSELALPNHQLLGWLCFAVGCALLNLLNDFIALPPQVLLWHHIRYLWFIPTLMALGFFALGCDYLNESTYLLNHLRHILTTGVIGLTYVLILSIVVVRHTGRKLAPTPALDAMMLLILLSLILRLTVIAYPNFSGKLYMLAALLWAVAFTVYLWRFGRYLWQENIHSNNLTEIDTISLSHHQ